MPCPGSRAAYWIMRLIRFKIVRSPTSAAAAERGVGDVTTSAGALSTR
jgi:hypothetical protein